MIKKNDSSMTTEQKEATDQLLDQLLADYSDPDQITGPDGLLKKLTKRLVEKAMDKEMKTHLGYGKHSVEGYNTGNSRNGHSQKTIKGDFGEVEIETPRDRNATFNPKIIPKNSTHFKGFDQKIISMYSRGMSTRDIQDHLNEIYGVEVSPDLISSVTEEIMGEVLDWQSRPLEKTYPILYLDAIWQKIKEDGKIINKAIYLVLGVNIAGNKDLLGLWVQKTEGAKFWLQVVSDLHNRGVEDIFIACVDGLKGFPEAINSMFPKTEVQLCIVHMIRNSLKFVSYKERKQVVMDLKSIYTASTVVAAEQALVVFGETWDSRYPTISKMWKNNWAGVTPFFGYSAEIRKAIYTTNAIESINYSLRKVTKTRASFPTDEAAIKLMYLAIRNISKKWTMPIRNWGAAINQFAVMFGDRVPLKG